jgi:hypothetical protein
MSYEGRFSFDHNGTASLQQLGPPPSLRKLSVQSGAFRVERVETLHPALNPGVFNHLIHRSADTVRLELHGEQDFSADHT